MIGTKIEEISQKISETNNLLDILIKKISQNSTPPQPWLSNENQEKVAELRNKNPELFDMVKGLMDLYYR